MNRPRDAFRITGALARPLSLLVVLCLCCSWLQGAQACGVTTHIVTATRAQRWLTDNYPALRPYASLVQANLPAFQNGAAFPDWGYACPLANLGFPQLPAMSEAAHWPPFQAAVVAHVLARYPATSSGGTKEWSPEAQALIAFLLGVVSHSVADITWHDLTTARQTQQGFIQALAEADYALRDQSYNSTQHTAADTYGEFIAAYELDLSFLSDDWYLPAEDLAQVFASLNFSVPPAVIDICVGELYAEVMAMKYLGKILYPGFAEDVPFMVDHYQDYWIGGVNDMATWTMQCWPNVLTGLDTGRPIQFCFEQGGPGAVSAVARGRRESLARAMRPYASQIAYDRTRTSAGGVLYASPSVKPPGRVVSPPPISPVDVSRKQAGGQRAAFCEPQTGSALGSSLTFTLPVGYSDAGRSLAVGDLDGDGLEDLVIGAPGFASANSNLSQSGAVFVVYGDRAGQPAGSWHRTIDLLTPPATTRVAALHGAASNARFGQAVAVLDFDLDGLLDLAVSAPGIGFEDLSYYGEVQVFLGRKGPGGLSFPAEPDVTITGRSRTWTNLGYTLAADCDLDGDGHRDLVIGSPYARGEAPLPSASWERFAYQRGAVSAFLARKDSSQPKKRLLDWRDDADWFQEGAASYDWFGTALVCRAFRGNNNNSKAEAGQLLVVSSPGAANVAKGQAGLGRVDGFLFASSSSSSSPAGRQLKARHVFGVSGAQRFDHLGQSLALGSSGPTVLAAERDDDKRLSASSAGQLWLAVGLPARALNWGITLQQAGAVVLLDVERDLFDRLNATIDQLAARATIESEQSFARLGELVLSGDLDGDGADDLLVASPHYDPDLSLLDAGAVYVWKGKSGSGFPATGSPVPPDSAWLCFHGDREYALYGEQAEVLDFNGDGRPDLVLSGPRDSRTGAKATHAGSVALVLR